MKKRMSDLMGEMEQYVNDLEEEVYELEEQLEGIGEYYLEEMQEYEMCASWMEGKIAQLINENAFLEKENAELVKQVEALEYRYNRLIEVVGKLINK